MYFVVKFSGPFGFIKPWTAVRDAETYSEKFLGQGTIEGMSQKLFGLGRRDRIQRYRLCFDGYSLQQERTQAIAPEGKKGYKMGVLSRGILLNPELFLAFESNEDANIAFDQHLCLCRNEDLIYPDAAYGIQKMDESTFDTLPGFEMLKAENIEEGIPAGRNRYLKDHCMVYGRPHVEGEPIKYIFQG